MARAAASAAMSSALSSGSAIAVVRAMLNAPGSDDAQRRGFHFLSGRSTQELQQLVRAEGAPLVSAVCEALRGPRTGVAAREGACRLLRACRLPRTRGRRWLKCLRLSRVLGGSNTHQASTATW